VSLALRGVDPYIKEAITWISHTIESWGGTSYIFSGRRTLQDQKELFDDCERRRFHVGKWPVIPCPYPVATPGCSQHEYGFAVDAGFYGPPSGRMTTPDWTGYAQVLAREYWGMHTVEKDPFHFAMYPSSEFLPWARETGQCPPERPRQSQSFLNYRDCLQRSTSEWQTAGCFQQWSNRETALLYRRTYVGWRP